MEGEGAIHHDWGVVLLDDKTSPSYIGMFTIDHGNNGQGIKSLICLLSTTKCMIRETFRGHLISFWPSSLERYNSYIE